MPTVAGVLRQALARTARMDEPPVVTCAGRTDAGVHARGQVVHVDLPPMTLDGPRLARALTRQLAPAVVVRSAVPVGDDFDARRSATARGVSLPGLAGAPAPTPCSPRWPGTSRTPSTWAPCAWPPTSCSAPTTSGPFAGAHRAPTPEPITRRVTDASLDQTAPRRPALAEAPNGRGCCASTSSAGSFCHNMVRSVVAALVDVGRGRQTAAELLSALRGATRHGMPDPAPAHGLCLVSVDYGG